MVPISSIFLLKDSTSFEQAANLIINPFLVALFIEKLTSNGHKAMVFTVAASALGKMVIRWAVKYNFTFVAIVRRQEQIDMLKELGAQHVLDMSKEGWKNEAKEICARLNVTVGFDSVRGKTTGDVMEIIQNGGKVYCYGNFSNHPHQVDTHLIVWQRKKLEGISVSVALATMNQQGKNEICEFVQEILDVFRTEHFEEIKLSGLKDAVKRFAAGDSHKVLIRTRFD